MFAALVALTLAAPVDVPDDKEKALPEAAQKELKKIEGKWKAVKVVVGGNEDVGGGKDRFIEFKSRKLILTDDGKEMEFFEVVAMDPSTTPKILDLKATVDEGPLTKGTVVEAIYKLDGDDLTIALYIGEGKKRPEKFESEKESMVILVALKREKK
jgi:uncharacterized protein (TIGR03067 family)